MKHDQQDHSARLIVMTVVSFAAMYALMYAMVASAADVYHNINQVRTIRQPS